MAHQSTLQHNKTVDEAKEEFFQEDLPQTNQQGLFELWEIKKQERETTWDLMDRFKDVIGKLSYLIYLNH